MSTRGSSGMSNGVRHGIGAGAGVVLTPVIFGALLFGIERIQRAFRYFDFDGSNRWLGVAALTFVGVTVALLVGTRISPLASLIPGALLTLGYLPWLVAPESAMRNSEDWLREASLGQGYQIASVYGITGLVGGVLLLASFPPSRWRATAPARPPQPQPPAPWGPPQPQPGHPSPSGAAGPPSFDPNARPFGAPRPAPGEVVPGQLGGPPAPPSPSPSPGPSGAEGARPDEDEPGEWTRMYGGGGRPQP